MATRRRTRSPAASATTNTRGSRSRAAKGPAGQPVHSSQARDRAYKRVIGADEFETFSDRKAVPAIEVRRYTGRPAKGGPVCDVWVTSGMSDLSMTGNEGVPIRRELIFYAPVGGDFASALTTIARFPSEDDTAIDHSHS